MMDRTKGFFITVFHGPHGPVHLVHGSWVDPINHVPLPAPEQKRIWHAFSQEHQVDFTPSGKGPDDGYTGHEI